MRAPGPNVTVWKGLLVWVGRTDRLHAVARPFQRQCPSTLNVESRRWPYRYFSPLAKISDPRHVWWNAMLHDSERRKCVDCGTASPLTETSYTLISPTHGWRLCKRIDAAGKRIMEWRCPDCWKKYKEASGTVPPSTRGVP